MYTKRHQNNVQTPDHVYRIEHDTVMGNAIIPW